MLLAGGCLALLYNLSHFALIRASSALSATVAGDLKIVLFTLLSMVPCPPPSRPLPHRKIVRFALTHWPQPQPHNSAPDQALFERPAPSPLVFIGTFIFLVGLAGYAYAANRDKRQLLCRDGREDGDAEGAPSAEEAYAAQVRAQVQRVKLEPQTPPPRRQTPPATETSTLIGKQVR